MQNDFLLSHDPIALLDAIPDALVIINASGKIVHINRQAETLFGYIRKNLLDKPIETLLPKRYRHHHEQLRSNYFKSTQLKPMNGTLDLYGLKKNGLEFPIEISLRPLQTQTETHILAFIRDVSECRQPEQALQKSETQFRQFAENLPEVIWIISYDLQKVIYISAAYEKVWGKSADSLYNGKPLSWLESIHEDDRSFVYDTFAHVINEQKNVNIEYRIHQPDGTIRWIHSRGFLIRNAQNEVYGKAGIASDITERKEAEKLSHQYQTELAQMVRVNSMGEMASALAHELNQPLTALSNYISGCIHRLEEGTFQQEEILHAMKKAAKNAKLAGDLIHRMKNFVRQSELLYEEVNINDLIKEAVSLIHYEMYSVVPITLQFELDANLPPLIIDKIQIEQVLLNLLRNSIDAMAEINLPKPTIILKTCALNSNNIMISVSDCGTGIIAENIDSLFKPYFTTKPRDKGMGMGLAICFTIIEAHGGQISAHTLSEGGACFQFTLPVHHLHV